MLLILNVHKHYMLLIVFKQICYCYCCCSSPVVNTINGLLTSDEFVRQGIKLKWIGQRIKR